MTFTPTIKDPAGRVHVRFEYGQPGGMPVTAIVGVSIQAAGRVVEVAPLVVAAQHAGSTYALVSFDGGTDGELYAVECTVTTGDGDYPQRVEILCADLSWRIPGVALPTYVDIAGFVARAGLDRTIRLTDEFGRGAIDAERLERALLDAQSLVDSYLATKYAVPLAAPLPDPIVTLTYDLAIARLHAEELPPQIERREEAAKKLLADLASGRAALTIPAVATPTPAAPVLVQTGQRIFSRESMKGL